MQEYKGPINLIDEKDNNIAVGFRNIVLHILKNTNANYIVPLVGEVFFIRPISFIKMANALHHFDDAASIQLRLGIHLSSYKKLKDMYPNRFLPEYLQKYLLPLNISKVKVYDSTVGCMHVCDNKRNNASFLNDFWFSTNLNGPLYNKKTLFNAWNDIDFNHPGDLEGNWYFLKARLPKYHLMLTNAVLLQNDGRAETRPDHLLKKGHVNVRYEGNCEWQPDGSILTNRDRITVMNSSTKLSWLYKQYENMSLNTTRIYIKK